MSAYGSLVVGWKLDGRHILIIGGNQIAANRLDFALDAKPTSVTLVYPRSQISCQRILELVTNKSIVYHDSKFNKSDLDSKRFDLILTAVDDLDLSTEIALIARDYRIPINVAEAPGLCDFLFMPTYRNGHMQIAISTAISSTTQQIAHKLRQHVIENLPDEKEVTAAANNVSTIKDALGASYAVVLGKITSSLKLAKLAKLSEEDIRRLIAECIVSGVSDEDEADKVSNSSGDEKKSDVTVVDEHIDNQLKFKSRINDILFNPSGSLLTTGGTHFIDGKTASAYIAYAMSNTLFVYPTTRANYNGQVTEDWSSKNLPNAFGRQTQVIRMETRSGAALAVTGAASMSTDGHISALATSQSLISMLPSLYTLAYEQVPFVLHVSAYACDDQMGILSDHSDVLSACETGAAILFSLSAQETHDIALISHLAANECKTPFLHVFDGVRTAHRFIKTHLASHKQILKILNDVTSLVQNTQPVSAEDAIDAAMVVVGRIASKTYEFFEYYGADDAEIVLMVVGGESNIIGEVISQFKASGDKIGALLVRVYRPWSEKHFLNALPTTTKCVVVLEQSSNADNKLNSSLFNDVVSSIHTAELKGKKPSIINTTYSTLLDFSQQTVRYILKQYKSGEKISLNDIPEEALSTTVDTISVAPISEMQHCIFWDVEHAGTVQVASHISSILSKSAPLGVVSYSNYDIYNNGGVVVSHLYFGTGKVYTDNTKADYITIHDTSLIGKYDILGTAKEKSVVLLNTGWTVDELDAKLSNDFKLQVAKKGIQLYIIDAEKIVQDLSLYQDAINIVLQAALLRLYKHELLNSNIKDSITSLYEGNNHKEIINTIHSVIHNTRASLTRIDILPTWLILEESGQALPSKIIFNSFSHDLDYPQTPKPQSYTWHTAAKLLLFKEAYHTTQQLRPDLAEKTFIVKVTENRRLTPENYERYLFHIEFDVSGTGLKYDLGEALGVYAHNDTDDVNEFLAFYGLDPDKVVSIPDKDGTHYESRTIFQVFSQMLDIFGRPSKKFYESLAQYATDVNERKQLLWIASSEGTSEFKRRVEDTITYAELLYEFASAKPPLEDLVQLVTPIKPRHYSIASSQSVHPTEVHLLVVTVDWNNSAGKKKFGQCTRYLSGLKVGESVTVSIKPSVMKLPPRDEQPVIMAGLGTGMAPFRAFIEERAYRKSKGIKVGPMILYFGSRNRSMEYLYGEELEAYHHEGLLTYLRLAFSRDQPHKIYIQHKMQEDSELLHDFLMRDEGWFYLCGPTWPVPDVRDAIVSSFVSSGGMTSGEASDWVNKLKDLERYILEVY